MITRAEVNKLLRYDLDTGYLFWKVDMAGRPVTGNRAGGVHNERYISIGINGKQYLAHRIIWLIVYGEFPTNGIDHINHNRSGNRIENLRNATNQDNARNANLSKANTSGVTGVYWHTQNKKWMAAIKVKGKLLFLGTFIDWFDAVCARKSAEGKYNFHPNHGQSPPTI